MRKEIKKTATTKAKKTLETEIIERESDLHQKNEPSRTLREHNKSGDEISGERRSNLRG